MKNLFTKFLAIFLSFCLLSMQATPLAAQQRNGNSKPSVQETANQVLQLYNLLRDQSANGEGPEDEVDEVFETYKEGWLERLEEICKSPRDESDRAVCNDPQMRDDDFIREQYEKDSEVANMKVNDATGKEIFYEISKNFYDYLIHKESEMKAALNKGVTKEEDKLKGLTDILPMFVLADFVDEDTHTALSKTLLNKSTEQAFECESGREVNCPLDEALALATMDKNVKGLVEVFSYGFNHPKLGSGIVSQAGGMLLELAENDPSVYSQFEQAINNTISRRESWLHYKVDMQMFIPGATMIISWIKKCVEDHFLQGYYNSFFERDGHNNISAWVNLGQQFGYLATQNDKAKASAKRILAKMTKNQKDVVNPLFVLGLLAQGISDKDASSTRQQLQYLNEMGNKDMHAKDRVYVWEGMYEAYKRFGGNPVDKSGLGISSVHSTETEELQEAYDNYVLAERLEIGMQFLEIVALMVDLIIALYAGGWIALLVCAAIMVGVQLLYSTDLISHNTYTWLMGVAVVIGAIVGIRGAVKNYGKMPVKQLKQVKSTWTHPEARVQARTIYMLRKVRAGFLRSDAGRAFMKSRAVKVTSAAAKNCGNAFRALKTKIKNGVRRGKDDVINQNNGADPGDLSQKVHSANEAELERTAREAVADYEKTLTDYHAGRATASQLKAASKKLRELSPQQLAKLTADDLKGLCAGSKIMKCEEFVEALLVTNDGQIVLDFAKYSDFMYALRSLSEVEKKSVLARLLTVDEMYDSFGTRLKAFFTRMLNDSRTGNKWYIYLFRRNPHAGEIMPSTEISYIDDLGASLGEFGASTSADQRTLAQLFGSAKGDIVVLDKKGAVMTIKQWNETTKTLEELPIQDVENFLRTNRNAPSFLAQKMDAWRVQKALQHITSKRVSGPYLKELLVKEGLISSNAESVSVRAGGRQITLSFSAQRANSVDISSVFASDAEIYSVLASSNKKTIGSVISWLKGGSLPGRAFTLQSGTNGLMNLGRFRNQIFGEVQTLLHSADWFPPGLGWQVDEANSFVRFVKLDCVPGEGLQALSNAHVHVEITFVNETTGQLMHLNTSVPVYLDDVAFYQANQIWGSQDAYNLFDVQP